MKQILIVEDDPTIAELLSLVLNSAGYETRSFLQPERALEFMRSEPVPYGLIFLDLMMPGMDGVTFFREARKLPAWSAVPTVLMSAASSAKDAVRTMEGVVLLTKPFELDDIFRLVKVHGRS